MANKVISSVNNGLNSAQNISQRKSHLFSLFVSSNFLSFTLVGTR